MSRCFTYLIHNISMLCVFCLLLLVSVHASAQSSKIRVQGVVTDIATQKELPKVRIIANEMQIGMSDIDGKYSVSVTPTATITFYAGDYEELSIQVNNRQLIDVELRERVLQIEEVVVSGKMSTKKVMVDQTDIQVIGEYFHLKTKFRVPQKLFTSDKRFVLQPTIYNLSRNERFFMKSVVMDGRHYDINNVRMFGFDSTQDKLHPYMAENNLGQTDYVYMYHDSIHMSNKQVLNDDFRADCYLALVGASRHKLPLPEEVVYKQDYLDSVTIARGTQNVLRFFEYKFLPLALNESLYIPEPHMILASEEGSSKIDFAIGKSQLDDSNPQNQIQIDQIKNRLREIQSNEYATIKSITMTGYASPEGAYEKNQKLAEERTKHILTLVSQTVDPAIIQSVSLFSEAKVLAWSFLADLLERDSLPFAAKVRASVSRHDDHHARCQAEIKRLPEYRHEIVPKYLPQLRRVDYSIHYSILRSLTDNEIMQKVIAGDTDISRYEYYRLVEAAKESTDKLKFAKDALKAFPNFTLLANRVAVHNLNNNIADLTLLEPMLEEDAPREIVYNQSLTALMERSVLLADSLASTLTDPGSEFLKAITATFNGRYEDAYPIIASKGGLNEVLILLCMNRNTEADKKISKLLENTEFTSHGKYWYIKAVCANRLDDINWGMLAMGRAIELDPSLEHIARLDSDVMDLIELVKPSKASNE